MVIFNVAFANDTLKGGYLDFSPLTEFKNYFMAEIYIKKKLYKSSIIRNHKIARILFYNGVPLKGYVAS